MTIRLSLRKRFRKLMANSKGFSSVIGTTFMVLVMMFLGTSVFLWTLSQNTLYNEAVKEKNQLEMDRLNERVKAFDAVYTVTDNDVSVSVELQNQGPLSVHITNLWVMDVNIGIYNFSKSLSINYLQPGKNAILTANVTIMGAASEHRFSSWLITGRGNVVPLEEKEEREEITVADVAAGIGSVAMNFTIFKYYNVTYNGTIGAYVLDKYSDGGGEGYRVTQGGEGIAFRVCLTNFDRNGREINLSSASLLWALFPTHPNFPRTGWWYIVNVDDDGAISNDFTQTTLRYGVQTFVFFASSQEITDGTGFSPSSSRWNGPAAVNLMLVGKVGTSTYGQNVPFVSMYIVNSVS